MILGVSPELVAEFLCVPFWKLKRFDKQRKTLQRCETFYYLFIYMLYVYWSLAQQGGHARNG